VFVRAGSIVPLGPSEQWVGEKQDAPIEIRVYPGSNATFSLYEDEGTNYDYEKGAYSIIPLKWNDRTGELTIERRLGSFPGMRRERQFSLALMKAGNNGEAPKQETIVYDGDPVTMRLQ
jgi:alpha-D-xyloside xylohydrolase